MKINSYQMIIIAAGKEYYFAESDGNFLKFTFQII